MLLFPSFCFFSLLSSPFFFLSFFYFPVFFLFFALCPSLSFFKFVSLSCPITFCYLSLFLLYLILLAFHWLVLLSFFQTSPSEATPTSRCTQTPCSNKLLIMIIHKLREHNLVPPHIFAQKLQPMKILQTSCKPLLKRKRPKIGRIWHAEAQVCSAVALDPFRWRECGWGWGKLCRWSTLLQPSFFRTLQLTHRGHYCHLWQESPKPSYSDRPSLLLDWPDLHDLAFLWRDGPAG